MDKDYYVIFSSNDNDKLLFVEKHEKDDTILKVKTYSEWLEYAKSIGYEVVDISLWKYENYEEKCLQVQNYNKMLKKEFGSNIYAESFAIDFIVLCNFFQNRVLYGKQILVFFISFLSILD